MTPKRICNNVEALLSKLGFTIQDAVYLPTVIEPNAVENQCFNPVDAQVLKHGGRKVLGWQIAITPMLIEALLHAVWEDPNGALIDLRLNATPCRQILFVVDGNIQYDGKQIDSHRMNILGNQLVDDFIEIFEVIFRIYNKGDREYNNSLSEDDLDSNERSAMSFLESMKKPLYGMVMENLTYQSQCPCQSGKEYQDCHGYELKCLMSCF